MTGEEIVGLIFLIVFCALSTVLLGFLVVWVFLKIIDIGLNMVSDVWIDLKMTWRDIRPVKIVGGEKE
jgi:hypothetical protein